MRWAATLRGRRLKRALAGRVTMECQRQDGGIVSVKVSAASPFTIIQPDGVCGLYNPSFSRIAMAVIVSVMRRSFEAVVVEEIQAASPT